MTRIIITLFLFFSFSFSATSNSDIWGKGETFLKFLETNNIPLDVYYSLYPGDKELTAEIYAGVRYYTLIDDGVLLQALIPLNDETQIHIFKEGDSYKVDFIPIKYFSKNNSLAISIQKSPYQDIVDTTSDSGLANEFINIYKNALNFSKNVLKGDKLALIYDSKYRLGRSLGTPDIKASLIETNRRPNFLFSYNGKYYDEKGDEVSGLFLQVPVNSRISSKFSFNRLHPILKVRRPHYGVDYAAPKGTKVKAAAKGVVLFSGVKAGYGNVVEIQHGNGLKTLYAHLDSYNVKKGQKINTGQYIARVGNSGLSTGAHLHFGLYRNNKPINPLLNVKSVKSVLTKTQKNDFLNKTKIFEEQLRIVIMDRFDGEIPKYLASN